MTVPFDVIWEAVSWFVPQVVALMERGIRGEDITHDELLAMLPRELKTSLLDKVRTERRRQLGLPT